MSTTLPHPTHSIGLGSSNYYASLFLTNELRQAVAAILALQLELQRVALKFSDITIALNKLHWWRQDIERLYSGQAEHPKLQAIQQLAQDGIISKIHLINMLKACQQDIEQTRYFDEISLNNYASLSGGSVYQALVQLLEAAARPTMVSSFDARPFGQAIRLAQIIINLGEDARLGRLYLPQKLLQQYRLTTNEILQAQYSVEFCNLLQHYSQQVLSLLQQNQQNLQPLTKSTRLFLNISTNIYRRQLLEIERSNFNMLTQHIDITPFNKLIISWKTKLSINF